VRKHLIGASATLVLAITSAITACGGSPSVATASPAGTCVNASAPHHAYVVVEHASGTTFQKCVGFSTDTIDGQTLMDQSGIVYQTETTSFGKAVCEIDKEPAQYTKCLPADQPYWNLFVEIGGAWTSAQTGYAAVTLHDKEALGWTYAQYSASPALPPPAKE
jgi:hypothetical protein